MRTSGDALRDTPVGLMDPLSLALVAALGGAVLTAELLAAEGWIA